MSAISLSNRLNRVEKAVQIELSPAPTHAVLTRYHGEEAREREREYILTMARARLGLCEPDPVIFISKRVKIIKEDCPGFPQRMVRELAKQLIKEVENEAA